MVLMAGRVGVGERERGCSQPRVVLKGSLWKQKKGTHGRRFKSAYLFQCQRVFFFFSFFFFKLG